MIPRPPQTPAERSRAALPLDIRDALGDSNLPFEVATAIADFIEQLELADMQMRLDASCNAEELRQTREQLAECASDRVRLDRWRAELADKLHDAEAKLAEAKHALDYANKKLWTKPHDKHY
jgi:hypothetical protein